MSYNSQTLLKVCIYFCCTLLICIKSFAQFEDVSSQWTAFVSTEQAEFGNGISLYDFNSDQLDDVTIAENLSGIACYQNNGNGFDLVMYFPESFSIKQILWVDFDNDNDIDLYYGTNGGGVHLLQNTGNFTFTEINLNGQIPADLFAYGAAWGDFDRDGLLDLYICSYNIYYESFYTNYLLHNIGEGVFEEVSAFMGVNSASDNSFQPCWYDFNQDGWLDLYIINDHLIGNEYYQNIDGQNFQNLSEETNLGVQLDAMCNTITDYDNDGDGDVYITNHWNGNFLMRNDDGYFANKAYFASVATSDFCWGALWLDYDLDGWDDLQVCNSGGEQIVGYNHVFHNDGDGTFTPTTAGNYRASYTCAKGDFNNDLRWDYAVYNWLPTDITIWQNTGLENHSIKISLEGTVSNREGIGSFIEYYIDGQRKILQTQCGENYISQDSQYEILALADNMQCDSLILHWPSGWTDSHYNLAADSFYVFVEGETFQVAIEAAEESMLCPGANLTLIATGNASSYSWSNGDSTQQISVDEPGTIFLDAMNEFGIIATTSFIVTEYSLPTIETNVQHVSCYGGEDGMLELMNDENMIASTLWNNESTQLNISNLSAGNYTAVVLDINGCEQDLMMTVEEPQLIEIEFTTDTICFGTTTSVAPIVSGGTLPYDIEWSQNVNPEFLAEGEYALHIEDTQNCFLDTLVIISAWPAISFEWQTDSACPGSMSEVEWTVMSGFEPYEVLIDGDNNADFLYAGEYSVQVNDARNCTVNAMVSINEYEPLSVNVNIVQPTEENEGSISLLVSGGTPPYAYEWNDENTTSVLSDLDEGVYSCIITDAMSCALMTDEYLILSDLVESNLLSCKIFPNPFSNELHFQTLTGEKIIITNSIGETLDSFVVQTNSQNISTNTWAAGVYFIHVNGRCFKMMKF